MIPKTIHCIYPVTERTRPWSIVNHTALLLARKHHPDFKVVIWTNEAASMSPMRVSAALSDATIKPITLPTHLDGVEIGWPQYVSDVLRLQILIEHGGVYMDTDILFRAPIDAHVAAADATSVAIMSWETPEKTSACNALMIAPPANRFLAEWLRRLPESLTSSTWAQGGVVLPALLFAEEFASDSRQFLDHTFACPLDLSRPWLFDPALRDEAKARIAGSQAIHVFESFWRDTVSRVDVDWVEKTDCLFSDIFNSVVI